MHQTSGSEDILRRISIHAANQVITTKCSPAFLFHCIYVWQCLKGDIVRFLSWDFKKLLFYRSTACRIQPYNILSRNISLKSSYHFIIIFGLTFLEAQSDLREEDDFGWECDRGYHFPAIFFHLFLVIWIRESLEMKPFSQGVPRWLS